MRTGSQDRGLPPDGLALFEAGANCDPAQNEPAEATRDSIGARYDLLIPEFIQDLAIALAGGAVRHGDCNWQKGLPGEKSPINHALAHIMDYMANPDATQGSTGHVTGEGSGAAEFPISCRHSGQSSG